LSTGALRGLEHARCDLGATLPAMPYEITRGNPHTPSTPAKTPAVVLQRAAAAEKCKPSQYLESRKKRRNTDRIGSREAALRNCDDTLFVASSEISTEQPHSALSVYICAGWCKRTLHCGRLNGEIRHSTKRLTQLFRLRDPHIYTPTPTKTPAVVLQRASRAQKCKPSQYLESRKKRSTDRIGSQEAASRNCDDNLLGFV